MPKYYISSGTLQLIFSTNKNPLEAACTAIWETNEDDEIGPEMFVDERGMRDRGTADDGTVVFSTDYVLKEAGWQNDA